MDLQIGNQVSYSFPEAKKTTVGKITFVGEEIIHIKSFEGFIVKVKWGNFNNIKKIDNADILVA